ncbi:hypothetical protein AMJ87_02670 [candidate division WOR_3 bacterium SM23_60]|uniref:Permease n=1 Tax=candidate division WOR_3 bacterium SM23_60 TaxID=1703780 RepID=A0A0S8GLD4_UNCW3|nr:MAG: hypothetical protein AMJ87_02670 [candidate division WOR_3 bacterium SM23_60]
MARHNRAKRRNISWFFVAAVIFIYVVIACVDLSLFSKSVVLFSNLIIKIIPIFIIIYVLMTVTHYFITPDFVTKHFIESGMRKWIFIIIGGILSTGPIYMWYPLLADLRKRGIQYGYIATFLYSRAIKVPLLPVILFYFSAKYVFVLTATMIIMSVLQGIAINKILQFEQ